MKNIYNVFFAYEVNCRVKLSSFGMR